MRKILYSVAFCAISSLSLLSQTVYVPGTVGSSTTANMGIGTNAPGAKLDIVTTNAHYSTMPSLRIKETTTRGTLVVESVANQPTDLVFRNNNRLSWSITSRNSSEGYALKLFSAPTGTLFEGPKITILQNGNVGIGTASNPANALDVNGVIRAKEVKVETGWADFVFEDGYDLPSLTDVEAHIIEHKHLPGIPAEAEVKANGVSLGEMNVKLLQKIEELTLYVIEQNKRIEALEKEIKGNE